MQWICSAMASCSRRCHRCLGDGPPKHRFPQRTWENMGRKYDNTITNLNMLHGNGHFPPFIDDFPIEITNFWGISSELDLDSWVQQDPAPGPAGGPWRRSKGWRSRRGATAKFQAGRLPWWTDSAAWFVDDPMEKWVMTTPVTKPLPSGKILPVCPNDYGNFNGVDDEKHWQTTKFRV